jgi:hypothetical protein
VRAWRRWMEALAFVCGALILSWSWTIQVQPRSARTLIFWILVLVILSGWGLSFLRNRAFLVLKICYAVAVVLVFRQFNVASIRAEPAFLAFILVFSFAAITLRPYWQIWRENREPWWPALRRTARRLVGDWREDDAQFAEKVLGDKKR